MKRSSALLLLVVVLLPGGCGLTVAECLALAAAAGSAAAAADSLGKEEKGLDNTRILTEHVPSPIAGEAYSFKFKALFGSPPYRWEITSGALPAGLSMSESGVVSGTPVSFDNCAVTIRLTGLGVAGGTDSRTYVVEVRPLPKWTVLVYLDGDNNLEQFIIENLNALEAVGSTGNVNIVAQVDRIRGYDATNGDWTNARRYYVTRDSDRGLIGSPLVDIVGEVPMASHVELSGFVHWAVGLFPAERYCLIINDHGLSWEGVLYDDTSWGSMSLGHFAAALENVSGLLGRPLDVLGFDACLMAGYEICAVSAPHADYMFGSIESIPAYGLDYEGPLCGLCGDAAMEPADLARSFVYHFGNSAVDGIATLSAIDLRHMAALGGAINDLCLLVRDSDEHAAAVTDALLASECITYSGGLETETADLANFAGLLGAISANASVAAAAGRVADVLDNAVIAAYTGHIHPYAGGMTIYFPVPEGRYLSKGYENVFDISGLECSAWFSFIDSYYPYIGNMTEASIASFDLISGTCDYSVNSSLSFSVTLGNNTHNVRWLRGGITGPAEGGYYHWSRKLFYPSGSAAGGQAYSTGDWGGLNPFEWDGRAWALGNGDKTCRTTVVPLSVKTGVCRGRIIFEGYRFDYYMLVDVVDGRILQTYMNYYGALCLARVEVADALVPYVGVADESGDIFRWENVDGELSLGPSGPSLVRVGLDAGSYGMELRLVDLSGEAIETHKENIEIRE